MIAGFVVSGISLVGLVTVCIQGCDLIINSGSEHGRDYEILYAKLMVETTRLLIWVRLLASLLAISLPHCSGRFKQGHVRASVEQLPNFIRLLLSESNMVVSRYGLKTGEGIDYNMVVDGGTGF